MARRRGTDLASRLVAAALWIGVWQVASLAVGSGILLAGPLDTVVRLAELVPTGAFWSTVWSSAVRIWLGFAAGFVLALALGLAGRRWPVVERALAPALATLKSVPLVCIIVLLLMWVGSRRVSAIAVFLVVFPAVYFSVGEGLDARDPRMGEAFRVFGVGGLPRFLADTWQQLLPYLVATCRNVCGMAWKSGVAAEVIGSPMGTIGERVYQAKILLETADLFAWTIVVVALSWACERAFLALLGATGPASLRLAVRASARRGRRAGGAVRAGGVELRHATLGYVPSDGDEPTVVVRDLDLHLAAGERGLLADASGAGKTTLLRTVMGLLAPLSGVVEAPSRMSVVFQDTRLVEGLSAEGNVVLLTGCDAGMAHQLLLELLPADVLGRPVRELSGGQRRRVELVRALAAPGGAVLLDEPFASLDAASHRVAAAYVLRHLGGRTLLAASHAAEDAELLDARVLPSLVR